MSSPKTTVKQKAIVFIEFKNKVESILSAKEAGFQTVLITKDPFQEKFSLFDEILHKNLENKEEVHEVVQHLKKKYSIKAIISNYEDFVVQRSYLADRLQVPCSSVYSACCTRNKIMQRHALSFLAQNIPFDMARTFKKAFSLFKRFREDVFVKSIAGIKSQYVFHVTNEEELRIAVETIQNSTVELDKNLYNDFDYFDFHFNYPDPKKYFLIEKAEYGKQITILSLIGNHKIWHGPGMCDVYTAKNIGKDDSYLAFRILPSSEPVEIEEKAKHVVETAISILGSRYCGIHAELLLKEDGTLKIIEIASRIGGYRPQMYKSSYNINIPDLLIKAAVGKNIQGKEELQCYTSLVEIFAEKEGVFEKLEGQEMLQNDSCIKHFVMKTEFGHKTGKALHGYRPICSFMIQGESYEEVYEKSVFYHKTLTVITV